MKRMKLPGVIHNLEHLIAMISECARQEGFSQERVSELEVAVEEALINICFHAYDEAIGEVEVRCFPADENDRLVVEIIDSGKAFNPLSAPEPILTPHIEQRDVGGLGIFFIRKMSDQVEYSRSENQNLLSLTFYKAQKNKID